MPKHNRWLIEQSLALTALAGESAWTSLLNDPAAALAAEGVTVPEGVTVRVVADQPSRIHLVVPSPAHSFLGELDGTPELRGFKNEIASTGVKAARDPAFLAELRERATAMAREHLADVDLPEDLVVVVLEEDASTVYLSVPYHGRRQLLNVAG